ncbi:extracellular metalloproteinase 4 [Geobacter sp. OR-1]|uniref:M36 family metallopeptidase n=1 Tax=Geobacter sp. OR-1 TaxID=1266765 RepID=UPI0005420650|nr:M36 family metallopeptidase [Geobacter sp. OR-1]GAM10158.1 extracellular metalloproteinase 4 [Geobacter sp. OR-1]
MKLDLTTCKVRWDRDNYVPKKVYDFETEPLAGDPRKVAEAFLKENLAVLKISAALSDLQFEQVTESLGGKAVLFQQHFDGTPIHGAWVAIHINNANRIFMVMNDTVPAPTLEKKLGKRKAADFLSDNAIDAIIARKAAEYGTLATEINKENMVYAMKGTFRPVCKVKFGTEKPAGSWILFIDRVNGHVIDERNVLHKATGKGKVFLPNPVVTLDRDDLLDLKDGDNDVFAKAYKPVQLKELDSSGFLKGPYVDTTKTRNAAKSATLDFQFTRSDERFEEVMAYFHIDAVQRYIQSLGFTGGKGILNRQIRVNAHGTREDNSFYDPSPGRKDITFGDGGVDDAEDAEIIIHEYGHAIQDAIVPGYGQKTEGRAMGEGFGDYLAGTFYYRYKKAARKLKLGEWDAKGYQGGPQECLRRLESTKLYPADMDGEEHSDGEIWSAVLWQVRKLLGAKKSDTVILESHFYLSQYSDFKDGAEAIIMAEKNLYGGKRTKGLTRIFKNRGILA